MASNVRCGAAALGRLRGQAHSTHHHLVNTYTTAACAGNLANGRAAARPTTAEPLLRVADAARRPQRRHLADFVRGTTPDGTPYKVPLKSPKVVGVVSSRGERAYQEDATAVCALELNPEELARSLSRGTTWDPVKAGPLAGQVSFFGIYDGHGGRQVSQFLQHKLAALVESVTPADIQPVVESTVELGGYFRRWRGGPLRRFTEWTLGERAGENDLLTIEERLTLAFLKADMEIRTEIEQAEHCGSTATVVLVHSLDTPAQPHWATKRLHLTMAQVGDTRALLCNVKDGEVIALTDRHHAEARVEADRLRSMGADRLISDSFGETRWMGAIENTRGFGDTQWKASGVTCEPEVTTRVVDGDENAYLILVTDGLTSMLSDQELVDLARRSADPTRAAKTVIHFGEDLGARDNCTCVVVPLAGWGKVTGPDTTEARPAVSRYPT
ncbi:uncharacterized protein EHS24_001076 [Apiotrichum porosum]|uniref:PPM-type phosphatase domain-containing protein n=1 Tax=Apiotrichum porosum TaxID=105984 RepID=A0A427YBJ8_9TREE|nr:uncharacterized protein EHS24_001076 [Apiotrichum porosum]RSH88531.1 hypothetical protein EHS24_001076 [Apiotrichum porosum]